MTIPRRIKLQHIAGFTLIEMLVATTVLLVLMVGLLQLTGGVGQIWRSSAGKISAFQNARSAFATINRTLARSTLNTYNDYVDASENYRTILNSGTFSPNKFMRASELQFLCGPTALIVPGADAVKNPGDAIFFQAPMGDTDQNALASLNRTLNTTGFFLQYGSPDDALLPGWLQPLFGATKRFRLVQFVEPTENLKIYTSTATPGYSLDWLAPFGTPAPADAPRARVLAEDVSLLIFRPRLSPKDEEIVAPQLGTTFTAATQGSILSPNYHYDSRAWEASYPSGQRVKAASSPAVRANIMRNQVPPIVDVAMVSLDRRSLARFDQTSDTPPAVLQVPSTLFTDASKLDADLTTYGKQLSDSGIRYRVFRTSVEIQGAKWSNN
ncbi:MAG: prepilin-type N-terminal cleavage/methylation domain-containing protein [Terrimicrobiaceae bacterium]